MRFNLPIPPSINETYRGARGGGRLIYTDVAAAYRTEQGLRLNQIDTTPLRGPCVVWMYVYMRYPRKGDHHNNHKLVLDLLEGRAYENDSQIVSLHIERCYDKHNPHVEIEVIGK